MYTAQLYIRYPFPFDKKQLIILQQSLIETFPGLIEDCAITSEWIYKRETQSEWRVDLLTLKTKRESPFQIRELRTLRQALLLFYTAYTMLTKSKRYPYPAHSIEVKIFLSVENRPVRAISDTR